MDASETYFGTGKNLRNNVLTLCIFLVIWCISSLAALNLLNDNANGKQFVFVILMMGVMLWICVVGAANSFNLSTYKD